MHCFVLTENSKDTSARQRLNYKLEDSGIERAAEWGPSALTAFHWSSHQHFQRDHHYYRTSKLATSRRQRRRSDHAGGHKHQRRENLVLISSSCLSIFFRCVAPPQITKFSVFGTFAASRKDLIGVACFGERGAAGLFVLRGRASLSDKGNSAL